MVGRSAWTPLSAALAATFLVPSAPAIAAATDVKPYAVSIVANYVTRPLLSVGDIVPETSDPSLDYQMIGIPDGLGSYRSNDGRIVLFMNHELGNVTLSEPVQGRPLNRGAFVSKFMLDEDGTVLSGERSYDTVYQENKLIGPAAQANNATPGFGRLCSAFLAEPRVGFDRYIYLTNEEAGGSATFDGLGGQTVAIFDKEAHALPKLGHFAKENNLVMPSTSSQTVIFSLEDGPSGPDSQLYMYVGTKDRRPGATVLRRNGLDNGKLYAFVANAPFRMTELSFREGAITGRWVEIPGAESMSDVALEAAADARGAFGFVRIEDGAFSKTYSGSFYFVTTGGNAGAGNKLGRLYHLRFDPNNPLGVATLEIVYNADRIIANGGDIAISPDNLDVSKDFLMIQEDGTSASRPEMVKRGRDGSIWRFSLNGREVDVDSALRVAELDPPGRDGVPVGAGVWETSGIIDASGLFEVGWWLFDVQAHPPTNPPAPNTVEDGQLLVMAEK